LQEDDAAAGKGAGDGRQQQQVPAHWEAWNSPALGKRPSRAVFVEWGECLLLPSATWPAYTLLQAQGACWQHHPCLT
jgi:hypothetical protein